MLRPSVLIVDDERAQGETLRRLLALEGFEAHAVGSAEQALEEVSMRMPDAIVSDYRMGRSTGLDLFLDVKKLNPSILFILVTGYGTLETAVTAMKAGVHDFLTKPVDTDELVVKLKKAIGFRDLSRENAELKHRIAKLGAVRMIAESKAMKDVLVTVRRVAASEATVLIYGESGTGKELVAKTLHAASARASGPYIKVNCAAIPENLLESEFFGHEAGAFTGAIGRREGRFAVAKGGTIFLDEIGELPLHLQPKLLRVLQEREFERIGGNETLTADVRVVAATNRDLASMVRAGEFREDLFYRLNVIPVVIPPLRERPEDIVPLARHFVEKYGERNGRSLGELDQAVARRLLAHTWPGNVRELENSIERAVVLAQGDHLAPEDFILQGEARGGGIDAVFGLLINTDLTIDQLEDRLIVMMLDHTRGNVSQAARTLGLTRRALQYRLAKIRGEAPGTEDDDEE